VGEFAIDVEAIAAAVRIGDGDVVSAITTTVPMYRFESARGDELTAR
jgi:DNA-binding IclR family transcriptional regulator